MRAADRPEPELRAPMARAFQRRMKRPIIEPLWYGLSDLSRAVTGSDPPKQVKTTVRSRQVTRGRLDERQG